MNATIEAATHRALIRMTPTERDQLRAEAGKLGLRFATHVHSILTQHLQASRKRGRK